VSNATLSLTVPAVSASRPFLLRPLSIDLLEVRIPNEAAIATPFTIEATVVAPHPVLLTSAGEGIFFHNPIQFSANTLVRNIVLPDFAYLYGNAPVVPQSGTVSFMSRAVCKSNFLTSTNRVEISGLRIKILRGGPLAGTWLGLPANAFARFLEDQRGTIALDVPISGPFDHLKADLKTPLAQAVSRAAHTKLAGPVAEAGRRAAAAVQRTGRNAVEILDRGILNRQ